MKTPNRWLTGAGIAAAAIGAALFIGGLGFAHWGDDHAYLGGMGPYGASGCPMWGGGRWGGPMSGSPMGMPISGTEGQVDFEIAEELARAYLARYGDGLEVVEVMGFSNHFYVEVVEKDTGIGAMELLVWQEGRVTPEPGPNMMWNRKYGHTGMWGFSMEATSAEMSISPKEAVAITQGYLDQAMPGAMVDSEADAFYGYYTIHILRDGRIAGMLSVNGYTGQVWFHSWHGEFVGMEEGGHAG